MRLVKSIVNTNNKLIGFVAEGTRREFGDKHNTGIIHRNILLDDLIKLKFKNNQIHIVGGHIEEKNKFKLNELPMLMYDGISMVDVNNGIELTHRLTSGELIVGYRVILRKVEEYNYKTPDIIKMSKWFKPKNFEVAAKDKNGLEEIRYDEDMGVLPIINLGSKESDNNNSLRTEKLKTPTLVDVGDKDKTNERDDRNNTGTIEKHESNTDYTEPDDRDLLNLMEIVKGHYGIIYIPKGIQYKKSTNTKMIYGEKFIDLGIGEVAAPFIRFPERSINASIICKDIGNVVIDNNHIVTYVIKAKNIILNGEINMDKLVLGLSRKALNEIIDIFGRDIVLGKLSDESIIDKLIEVVNLGKREEEYKIKPGELVLVEVGLDSIPIMSEYNARKNLLSNKEIAKLVEILQYRKAQLKYVRGAEKEVLEIAQNTGVRLGEGYLEGPYASADRELLTKLITHNISLETGEFKDIKYEGKVGEVDRDKDIEIVYRIPGMSLSKISYESMKYKLRHTLMNKDLIELVDMVESIDNIQSKYEVIKEVKEALNGVIGGIKEMLWKHKYSMYILGSRGKLAIEDGWEEIRRSPSGITYRYEGDTNDLELFTKGVRI